MSLGYLHRFTMLRKVGFLLEKGGGGRQMVGLRPRKERKVFFL